MPTAKQEMPFWQQKSAKKGPKMYLLNRPNLISIILRFDDRRSTDQESDWFG